MKRCSLIFSMAVIFFLATSHAQTNSAQDYTFTIPTTQAWTDTGLDLQSGDVLQISATAASSVPDRHAITTAVCDPKGTTADQSQSSALPLPSAPAGALIARLHAQGAMPILVGTNTEIHIEESSHLFFGANTAGVSSCVGSFAVHVHKLSEQAAPSSPAATAADPAKAQADNLNSSAPTPAKPASASTTSAATPESKTRGEQLKSQLATAAQIFMSGQFGSGKSESSSSGASNATSEGSSTGTTTPAVALKLSDAPLDSQLRKSIDSLPRRVNDQLKNQGDMVNFVIVGSQKDVQAVLEAANWHVADTNNKKAVLNAVLETYQNKDYLAMPMSTLYLFDRQQDFGYEQAEPIAMVASRHHFRIWKAPFTWNGHEVWVGAGTHDIGFAKDKRNNGVTHKIDPAVDGERDNIGSSLQQTNKIKSLTYYLPPNPVQDARNATGDGYHSDGRVLVIQLQ